MQKCKKFREVFKCELEDYWIDSVRGLDVEKFRQDLVESNGQLLAAVREEYGTEGSALVRALTPLPKKKPKPS